MCVASLVFSGRAWLWPVAVFLGVALLALISAYSRAPAGGTIRAACLLLKVLGMGVLAACLLDPLWSGQRARPGAKVKPTQEPIEADALALTAPGSPTTQALPATRGIPTPAPTTAPAGGSR